jgi:hypothetical protein
MKTIATYVASPIGDNEPDTVNLIINLPLPCFDSLAEAEAHHEAVASMIFDALVNSLPGGTFDRLLGLMHARKASLFSVPLSGSIVERIEALEEEVNEHDQVLENLYFRR